MNGFSKVLTLPILLILSALVATGCNTVKGAGKDIQKGGEAVQDAAEKVEK